MCGRSSFLLNSCSEIIPNPCFKWRERMRAGVFLSVLCVAARMVVTTFYGSDTIGLYPFLRLWTAVGGEGEGNLG